MWNTNLWEQKIHLTTYAILCGAITPIVFVTEEIISDKGIVDEAL